MTNYIVGYLGSQLLLLAMIPGSPNEEVTFDRIQDAKSEYFDAGYTNVHRVSFPPSGMKHRPFKS